MIIDISILLYNTLPLMLQQPTIVDFMRVALFGLRKINQDNFLAIGYNSSVWSQELYLNTLYGIPYNPNTRDADILAGTIIWIENRSVTTPDLVWYADIDGESTPVWYSDADGESGPVWYSDADYISTWDFRVNVPVATLFNMNVLKGQIKRYLPEGRAYVIQTY